MTTSNLAFAAAAAILLAGVAAAPAARADIVFLDPTVTLTGDASGSATDKDGKPAPDADKHAKEYDGPTEFKIEYTIALKDGKFDPTLSKVTFKTVYYTGKGVKTNSTFTTLELPISDATIDKDNMVESFSFDTTDWYPDAADDGIKNNGIKGKVDLKGKTGTFTSSYIDKSTDEIYKYVVKGTLGAGGAPEPASWALMIGGLGLVGGVLRRRRRPGFVT